MPGICPGNTCTGSTCIVLLTRMHEDMLSYRGECVTHWEIQVFR